MDYADLVEGILTAHRDSVGRATMAVNQALVLRNWMIGAYLVEFEQDGKDRAAYGEGLLRRLAKDLSSRGIKGFSPDMLERMRLLFRVYPQLATCISAPPVRNSVARLRQPAADQGPASHSKQIGQRSSRLFRNPRCRTASTVNGHGPMEQ